MNISNALRRDMSSKEGVVKGLMGDPKQRGGEVQGRDGKLSRV